MAWCLKTGKGVTIKHPAMYLYTSGRVGDFFFFFFINKKKNLIYLI